MAERKNSFSKTLVWGLLVLLFVGLAGFGATNFTGTMQTIAFVGDRTISIQDYARALQQEQQAIQAQTGQAVTMSQLQASGVDQQVLGRLIGLAAIDNEVSRLGISVGDDNLRKEILAIPAFQGVNGKFDRNAYNFALQQAGISESEFEDDVRIDTARTVVQDAVVSGVAMPATMTDTLLDFIASRRSFSFVRLGPDSLEAAVSDPSESDLQAFYDAHIDRFQLPETKQITYVMLTPEMVVDSIDIEEDALRRLYDDRAEEYLLPERRLAERLVFNDEAAANDALAQLEVGGTTFEQLVANRGLEMEDVDMGDVTRDDLGSAADIVFGADTGSVVGPVPTPLGPAIFRINGRLEARETPFEDVQDDLRSELALERAGRAIEARMDDMNNLLAEGMTLEELAADQGMELAQFDWTADSTEGPAAYEAFREAAAAVSADDYPEAMPLEDGGAFAMRLDATLPARPQPFADAIDNVEAAWLQQATLDTLKAEADEAVAQMGADADFVAADMTPEIQLGLTRNAFLEGFPPDFMTQVFQMDVGEVRVVEGAEDVYIVRLDEVLPPEDSPQLTQMQGALSTQFNQSLAESLYLAFASDAQRRARPEIDQNAVNSVNTSFR
ncbi:peptidyl-prolyl cis-trans isomerase [Chachezhania sediminis]|uniref:peptidyl-prolyl cis-trans isomerase n=1 Tax=Chachezhania sediminis TaxID=2599291 RepID=UPI00131B5FD3|nr:peptidyl-prolyl cis-trans isomerase [Chachezhania sediminis]